jgi:hypothetical protein
MDAAAVAALHMAVQDAPAGSRPEIGAKEDLRHLNRRRSLDRDCKRQNKGSEDLQLALGKPIAASGAEGACHAGAHDSPGRQIRPKSRIRRAAERLEESEIVGKAQAAKLTEERKRERLPTIIELVPQLLRAGGLHVKEG